jgi:very-short-patch-repair endonuclease/DNA polymerase III delta prime subunit
LPACSSCGQQNSDDAKYCTNCGTPTHPSGQVTLNGKLSESRQVTLAAQESEQATFAPPETIITTLRERFFAKLEDWARKVVDLSRRNPSIFFKPTKSSTLKVIEPSTAEIFRHLILDEKPWQFYAKTAEVLSPLPRCASELNCISESDVQNVLKNLYRRAHIGYEERGARILHIAFGMLAWHEQEQSDTVRSPLLLVPVELRRESAAKPFLLYQTGDDPVLNPALKIRFWNDFHIELPEPNEWEDETLSNYLDRIAEKVAPKGFTVSDECWIGIFSFHKLPIYNDLMDHKELLYERPLVRALGGIDTLVGGEMVEPEQLDKSPDISQIDQVLDADSSQLACIESVKKGRHLIIQGPPGTGKSQTIVNLIAEFLAQGKSVLFVSEKMAALEVVYKRLKERGLGHLCLELHSDKANKRVVVEELHKCYKESVTARKFMSKNDLEKLQRRREQLNQYVTNLHKVQQPFGSTAYKVLGELAKLRRYPTLTATKEPASLTPNVIDETCDLSQRLSSVWMVPTEGATFPWRGFKSIEYTMDLRTKIVNLLTSYAELTRQTQRQGLEDATRFGLSAPQTLADFWFVEIGQILLSCPGIPKELLIGKGELYDRLRSAPSNERWPFIGIAQNYAKDILELDLNALVRAFSSSFRRVNPQFYLGRRKLRKLRVDGTLPNEIVSDLKLAIELKQAIEWTRFFLSKMRVAKMPVELISIIENGSEAAPDLTTVQRTLQDHATMLTSLESWFEHGYPRIDGVYFRDANFESMLTHLDSMMQRLDSLRDWLDYKGIERDFTGLGRKELFDGLINLRVNADELPIVVRKSFLQNWIDWLFSKEPILGQFRSTQHEQVASEFRELDRLQWKLGPSRVLNEAVNFRPVANTYLESEAWHLQHEALKKSRHLPIRKLFPLISNLLLKLKPCLLMSPLSVSQFLDPKLYTFDLVIFDEASQVRTEESIGAISRGRQLVVCGDEQQLPPTNFFEDLSLSDESYDNEPEEGLGEFESIIRASSLAGLKEQMLRWHYRSRHESLIAFSNHQFYDDKLFTFPSVVREKTPDFGVEFVYVANGVYDRGGKRNNPREAEVVRDLVLKHFQQSPEKSLGIVSFSINQANTIDDYVVQLRKDNPWLERFFDDKKEPEKYCFVKNLETVQGDERDVMIFSVGYGKDNQGRLSMNFGPLTKDRGERRLNVAITRARDKVYLISSIYADDFDLKLVKSAGVRQLYNYLRYAKLGPSALETSSALGGEYESPLEAEVASEIRKLGYDVIPQVGCSGYRIDLGVLDPEKPGKFLIGVECDGATYHSAHTARDRDRIRQQVLENLGWRLHRIWAPDFLTRREAEVKRLMDAIEQARISKSTLDQMAVDEKPELIVTDISATPPRSSWTIPYKAFVPDFRPPWNVDFNDPYAHKLLSDLLKQIVENEGPLHIDVAAHRVAAAWGHQRIGPRMRETVHGILRTSSIRSSLNQRGNFLWPKRVGFELRVRTPEPGDPRTIRSVSEIPPEEIELAYEKILEEALSMPRNALIIQVARVLGVERLSSESQIQLEEILDKLLSKHKIVERNGRLMGQR